MEEYYKSPLGWPPWLARSEIQGEIQKVLTHWVQRDHYKGWQKGPKIEIANIEGYHQAEMGEEKKAVEKLQFEIDQHMERVTPMRDHAIRNPESSRLIGWVIVGLFLVFSVAVVYPLALLPTDGYPAISLSLTLFLQNLMSLKGLMLGALFLVFSLVLLGFFVLNAMLRYPEWLRTKLRHYSQLENYSRYLAAWVENRKALGSSTADPQHGRSRG